MYDASLLLSAIRKISFLFFCFFLSFQTTAVHAQSEPNQAGLRFGGFIGHDHTGISGIMTRDVPHEQILRECRFYGGDSLNGFDFGAKTRQAFDEGNHLYKEFRVFMFRHQSEFVKSKFHIALLPFEIEMEKARQKQAEELRMRHEVAAKKGDDPSPAASCNNLDLEMGNYSGWLGGSGYNTNSNGPLTLAGTAYYNTDQSIYDCNDFQLITAAYGNDIVGNFPGKDPNGGNYSARVGGAYINRAQGYGGCDVPSFHWSSLYSNGEYIENTFAVNATNCLISYDYAVILNDGAHPNGQQPYFHVEIVNGSGTVLSSCTQYYVQAPANATPPGFTLSGTSIPTSSGPTYYKSWSANSINLTPYIGQTVTVRFSAAGCTQGGHFGYAYVDASCSAAQIVTSNANPCIGSTAILTAPPVAGGSYSWSGPGIVGPTNGQNVTVNISGTYTVTVTPAQGPGCAYTLTMPVTFTTISAPITVGSHVNCFGGNNGSATVSPLNGTPSYTYNWSPIGGTGATGTNLTAGNYTVTVTDANGCTRTNTVTITQPAAALSSTLSSTASGCTVPNGSASVNASGGTPTYTYAWTPSGQTTASATGLLSGTYTCVVTDSKGCTRTTSVSVAVTPNPSVTASATQATCNTPNGTTTANPSGGTPGYSYSWIPGGQTSQQATGLSPGNYQVTVTDMNGCTALASATVTAANGPTLTASVLSHVSCNGGNNGSATATPTGGTPSYTYIWSNGQSTQTATGLTAGTYTVIITDANNCSFSTTATINEPTLLSASANFNPVSCFGGSNGNASVTASGGTPNYTYAWLPSGGSASAASNLVSGNYTVTITDANGCVNTQSVSITEPTLLTTTLTSSNVLCNGGNSGNATVTPAGGTPGYTYAWSPTGGNAATANNLTAGNYTVVVTDANGCTSTQSISITQPNVLSATAAQTNVSCYGGSNGSASVTPVGGTPGYTYSWNPTGASTSAISGATAGIYICTITDANGCSSVIPVTISQPAVLAASAVTNNVLCNGGNNGSATVSATGGVTPYSYAWSPTGGNAAAANNLVAGSYQCVITDANGCSQTVNATITEPAPITLSVNGGNSICDGTGTILIATVNGGTPNYSFTWNPGPASGYSVAVSPTTTTNYTVTMVDGNGCSAVPQTFQVTVLPSPTALFDTASINSMHTSFAFTDMSSGSTGWYWDFGDGSQGSIQQHPTHTFPGAGTYTVTQVVYNTWGCPDTFRVLITIEPRILIPNVFTPDGNGMNDEWYIPNSGVRGFHVEIFDRWGLKLFETDAAEIRWDGRSNSGEMLTDGTYYYVLRAILITGDGDQLYEAKGHVTLLTEK